MLDYLMLRLKDRQLWEKNKPETLRYVVVDELHTFDGAQGYASVQHILNSWL
jgi:DEAD/DEAH box helicase domain-containing protein